MLIFTHYVFSGSGEDHEAISSDVNDFTPTENKSPAKNIVRSPSKTQTKRRTRTSSTSASNQNSSQVVHTGSRTIYTAGRPPWYDTHGQLKEAFVIGEIRESKLYRYQL